MSITTIDNSKAIKYQVAQQPGSLENLEYAHESRSTETKSKIEQYQSRFWHYFALSCCLCLCCNKDSNSDDDNCCSCDDGCSDDCDCNGCDC
jgi:hypothetical protein